MKRISIIGAGPGRAALLTAEARERLAQCGEVYAARRIAQTLAGVRPDVIEVGVAELPERLRQSECGDIAALVSGDVGFFSAAKTLLRDLAGEAEVELFCGVSSMQYLCAKAQAGYEGLKVVSLHGREGSLVGAVCYHPAVFVLTGGSHKAHDLCGGLAAAGLGGVSVVAGENLSMDGERILTGTAAELARETFADLTVLLVRNPDCAAAWEPLRDGDFVRGKVPMTKEEVRWIALSALRIAPGDTVYDVGAGTGSVAIEMARRACGGMVYAVERGAEGLALIEENRRRLGAYNVVPVAGEAPGALEALPPPDRVFVGGSGGNLREIVRLLLAKNPGVRIVVSAITLETLQEAVAVLEEGGFSPEIVCVNCARSKQAGSYHMMTANNPVYLISGERAGGE